MIRFQTSRSIAVLNFVVVGVVCVCALYVTGFLIGKSFYGTIEGTKRIGFKSWCKLYRPAIYLGADTGGYSLTEIDQDQWILATLESIDDSIWCEDGTMYTNFRRSDGLQFTVPVRWIPDFDIIPRIGGEYRLKVRVSLHDDRGLKQLLNEETLEWYVSEEVLNVESTAAEQDAARNPPLPKELLGTGAVRTLSYCEV